MDEEEDWKKRYKKKRIWNNKKPVRGSNKEYSLINKFRREGKSDPDFENKLSLLSLEEVIGLKLELASKKMGGKLFGLPLMHSMRRISEDAVFKYAISCSRSIREAQAFLGITMAKYYYLKRNLNTDEYFNSED
jgi:hypothetical protein